MFQNVDKFKYFWILACLVLLFNAIKALQRGPRGICCPTTAKTEIAGSGFKNVGQGLFRVVPLGYWVRQTTFSHLMRKGRNEEKRKNEKNWKKNMKMVATNIVTNWTSKCWPPAVFFRLPSQSTRWVDQIWFYSIKIRVETPEIKFLSVALLS